jgi:crossover junction endodeoxyribonuclease RuvC
MMVFVGIDPGVSGAVAFLDQDGDLIEVLDMPTMLMSATSKKQQVNAYELSKLFDVGIDYSGTVPEITAYVERVSSMPGQGVASMFNFGVSFGIIQGVLAGLSIPMQLVTPVKWKRHHGLQGADKDYARTKAQNLYPVAPLGRKKDIGRADALLIARYGFEDINNRGG